MVEGMVWYASARYWERVQSRPDALRTPVNQMSSTGLDRGDLASTRRLDWPTPQVKYISPSPPYYGRPYAQRSGVKHQRAVIIVPPTCRFCSTDGTLDCMRRTPGGIFVRGNEIGLEGGGVERVIERMGLTIATDRE